MILLESCWNKVSWHSYTLQLHYDLCFNMGKLKCLYPLSLRRQWVELWMYVISILDNFLSNGIVNNLILLRPIVLIGCCNRTWYYIKKVKTAVLAWIQSIIHWFSWHKGWELLLPMSGNHGIEMLALVACGKKRNKLKSIDIKNLLLVILISHSFIIISQL